MEDGCSTASLNVIWMKSGIKELYGKLLRIMQGVEAQNGNICFYYICKNCMGKKQIIGVPKKPEGWPDEEVIII